MASLTLAEAEHILAAAKTKVLEMGTKMSVSVVDPRGDFNSPCSGRMGPPGAPHPSPAPRPSPPPLWPRQW